MTPNELGRHCNACAKTVVDFTQMSDEAVQLYLLSRHGERICGRFSTVQLHRIEIHLPQNIFELTMPWWKRFLVASLIVFSTTLFSCDVKTNGDIVINDSSIQEVPQSHKLIDTATPIHPLYVKPDSLISTNNKATPVQTVTVRGDIQGDIVLEPIPEVQIIPNIPSVVEPDPEPKLMGEPAVVPHDSTRYPIPIPQLKPVSINDSMIKGRTAISPLPKENADTRNELLVGKIKKIN
jgi:hypothetical protein